MNLPGYSTWREKPYTDAAAREERFEWYIESVLPYDNPTTLQDSEGRTFPGRPRRTCYATLADAVMADVMGMPDKAEAQRNLATWLEKTLGDEQVAAWGASLELWEPFEEGA